MLANLRLTGGWFAKGIAIDSADHRRWQFFGWKEGTRRFRMKRGLPVVHVGDSLDLFKSRLLRLTPIVDDWYLSSLAEAQDSITMQATLLLMGIGRG